MKSFVSFLPIAYLPTLKTDGLRLIGLKAYLSLACILIACPLSGYGQALLPPEFTTVMRTTGFGAINVTKMAAAENGLVYIAGKGGGISRINDLSLGTTFPSGNVFACFNGQGRALWANYTTTRSPFVPSGEMIEPTADGGAVVSIANAAGVGIFFGPSIRPNCGDSYIAKLDCRGRWQWATPLCIPARPGATNASANIYHLVKLSDGGFAAIGTVEVRAGTRFLKAQLQLGQLRDSTPAYPSVFLARLDANGNPLWLRSGIADLRGTQGADFSATIAQAAATSANGVVISGTMRGKVKFGTDSILSNAVLDTWLARLDSNGTPAWLRICNYGPQEGAGLAVGRGDTVVACGAIFQPTTFDGFNFVPVNDPTGNPSEDLVVVKLSPQGRVAWARHAGSPAPDRAISVAVTEQDQIVVTGSTGPASYGPFTVSTTYPRGDYLLAVLSPSGRWQQVRSAPTNPLQTTQSYVGAVAVHKGSVYVAGYAPGSFYGSTNLGAGSGYFFGQLGPSYCVPTPPARLTYTRASTTLSLPGLAGCVAVRYRRLFAPRPPTADTNLTLQLQIPRDTGFYQATLTLAGGCDTLTNVVHVTDTGAIYVGTLPQVAKPALAAWPNPAGSRLTVRPATSEPLELLDARGRLVWRRPAEAGAEQKADLSTLPPGLYLLRQGRQVLRVGHR